jgi:hypothetical protein
MAGRFASFFGDDRGDDRTLRQNGRCLEPDSLRRLMNRASQFGEDRVQLVGILGRDDLCAKFADAILKAARALRHEQGPL